MMLSIYLWMSSKW